MMVSSARLPRIAVHPDFGNRNRNGRSVHMPDPALLHHLFMAAFVALSSRDR